MKKFSFVNWWMWAGMMSPAPPSQAKKSNWPSVSSSVW